MQYIPIHTLSMDDLPEEGASIVFFDSTRSFGMFDQYYTQAGYVEYLYGDIADSLEEALTLGGYITLQYSEDEMAIPVGIDGGELYEGVKWTYEHEYLPVLDEDCFPFQDWGYFQVAIKQGWCTLLSTDQEAFKMADSKEASGYRAITYVTQKVLFNSKVFDLEWVVVKGEYSFSNFKVNHGVKGE